jgi:hypothetical protein
MLTASCGDGKVRVFKRKVPSLMIGMFIKRMLWFVATYAGDWKCVSVIGCDGNDEDERME